MSRPRTAVLQKPRIKSPIPARWITGGAALLVGLVSAAAFTPAVQTALQPWMNDVTDGPVIGFSGGFLTLTLLTALFLATRDPYRSPPLPTPKRIGFDEHQDGLHVEKMLEKQFEYGASSAEQAQEHRMTIVNFYLLIVGAVASGLFALVGGKNELAIAAPPLLWVISLIGGLILLQLVALRRAWAGSVMEMNYIKEFYLFNSEHFKADELKQAFFWQPDTRPDTHKRGNVYYFSAMLIALLDTLAFVGGTYLLAYIQRAHLLEVIPSAIVIFFGIVLFLSHLWVFDMMLIPMPTTESKAAPQTESAPSAITTPKDTGKVTIQTTSYSSTNPAQPNVVTDSQIAFAGKLLTVRVDQIRQPDGSTGVREVVVHGPAVVIVPYLEATDEVIFIEQYRDAVAQSLLELPAGMVNAGEDHADAARRELREETGYEAGTLRYLGSYYTSPGFTNEQHHLYLAMQLTEGAGIQDVHEIHATHRISRTEALTMGEDGSLQDGKSILGLLWSAPHLSMRV